MINTKHCKDCFERLSLEDQKQGEVRCSPCRFKFNVMARQMQKTKPKNEA
jgi:DNA-directed RNA polymerase subunit RPC12/RpoP